MKRDRDIVTLGVGPAVLLLLVGLMLPAGAHEAPLRLTPGEIEKMPPGNGAGTSGVASMQTRILSGNPAKAGIYTIQITIPPHTAIQPHTHRDDRTAIVVTGTWFIGYGTTRSMAALKELPAGSFYTEPAGAPHFAGTGDATAVVVITGVGPSDTHYVTPHQ